MADGEEVGETMIHQIALFLLHPMYAKNQIIHNLRNEVKKVHGYEDILVHLLALAQVRPHPS